MSVQASVAQLNTSSQNNLGQNRFNPITSIVRFFELIKRANASAHYFETLSSLPATEIERMNLQREDLPKIAYERYFGPINS